MVFSSPIFLYVFLPIVLLGYFVLKEGWRNAFLLIASLLFYAWGEEIYVLIMIASLVFNYGMGRLINSERAKSTPSFRRASLIAGLAGNFLLLGYFKYFAFLAQSAFQLAGIEGEAPHVHLPLGISFFTFQAVSYLVDTYRGETAAQRNILNSSLYIALFPQLIAGPIVRYHRIASQLVSRKTSLDGFASGVELFIMGFGKKLIIANPLGEVADAAFALDGSGLTGLTAWIGLFCYSMQIYFDFSGYSDMARGLGRMFGFDFEVNFRFPYAAFSFRDFWRRWHITLSSWFRDYLYIPLGGNRCSPARRNANLWIVFILCGLWHGASWNFVIWGGLHGTFLALERWEAIRFPIWKPIRPFLVFLCVSLAWVVFRAETLPQAGAFYESLLRLFAGDVAIDKDVLRLLDMKIWLLAIVAVALSFNFHGKAREWLAGSPLGVVFAGGGVLPFGIRYLFFFGIFGLAIMQMAANQYNPFIYFRF